MSAASAVYEFYTHRSLYAESNEEIVMEGVYRVRGLFMDPNATGGMMALGGVALAGLMWRYPVSKFQRLLSLGAGMLLLFGLYATSSRTAIAGFAGVIPLVAMGPRSTWRVRGVLVVAVLLAMIVLIPLLSQGRGLSFAADESAMKRPELWSAGWALFTKSPLTGANALTETYYATHNNFVEVVTFGGLISIVPFIGMHVGICASLWRTRQYRVASWLASLFFACLVIGSGITWLNNVVYWSIMGICLAEPSVGGLPLVPAKLSGGGSRRPVRSVP
jgi:O-antigen ligase